MFDTLNEIQCCFCKVITKLDKFEDMIVNYAILSLAEHGSPPKDTTKSSCLCQNNKKNADNVDKLLECIDCKLVVCPKCIGTTDENSNIHGNHKLSNLADYINIESNSMSDQLKIYREVANKMSLNLKKLDKIEIEKYVKIEKDNLCNFYRDLKILIDKNQEIMIHCLDKLLKDSFKVIDNFKKEVKYFNSDSTRYCAIVEELCNYKNMTNKQRAKVLNIYNINSTLEEITNFNIEVNIKNQKLMTPELFMKKFIKITKNCEIYKNKMISFHTLIHKKAMKILEKGFESKINFYSRH